MNPTETVLVTGGSRGIGAAAAQRLAASGYAVCITYRERADEARAVVAAIIAAGGQAAAIAADAADVDAFAALPDRMPAGFAPLGALVNNAGITGPLGPFHTAAPATLRAVLDVNVLAVLRLSQTVVARWLAEGRRGSIVNVTSVAAVLGAPGEYVHYAASKAAIEAFTVGLAKELGPHGIRVNAVSPGITDTEIHATAGEPGRPQRVAAAIPLRRPAEADEIADAIDWLLSRRAGYVTGTVLKVAGGL